MEMTLFNSSSYPANLLTISEAAKSLDVSIKTLRRWEQIGLIKPTRSPLNHRLYSPRELLSLEGRKNTPLPSRFFHRTELYPISIAARKIGVSIKTLRRWDKAGKIECLRQPNGKRMFTQESITQGKHYKEIQDRVIIPTSKRPVSYAGALYLTSLVFAFTFGLVSTQLSLTPNPPLDQALKPSTFSNNDIALINSYLITKAGSSVTLSDQASNQVYLAAIPPTANNFINTPINLPTNIAPMDIPQNEWNQSNSNAIYNYQNNAIDNNIDLNSQSNQALPSTDLLSPSPLPQSEDLIQLGNLNYNNLHFETPSPPDNPEPKVQPDFIYLPTI